MSLKERQQKLQDNIRKKKKENSDRRGRREKMVKGSRATARSGALLPDRRIKDIFGERQITKTQLCSPGVCALFSKAISFWRWRETRLKSRCSRDAAFFLHSDSDAFKDHPSEYLEYSHVLLLFKRKILILNVSRSVAKRFHAFR